MAKKRKPKKITKAFRVHHKIKFPDGQTVAKSDYFETSDPVLMDLLVRCKEDSAVEVKVNAHRRALQEKLDEQAAAEATEEAKIRAPQDPPKERDPHGEPEWEFTTIPAMRQWLDMSGVELPPKSTRKATMEGLCKGAWDAGRRPSPLYGFPGGPVPSPGMAGPPVNEETLAEAITRAEAMGLAVPQETRDALNAALGETPVVPLALELDESEKDPAADAGGDETEEAAEPAAATAEGAPPQE